MIEIRKLEAILKRVEKPARYIGTELNSVKKDFSKAKVTFAFSYPDVYEVGMSHLGMHILYNLMNNKDEYLCERVFAPWPDMEEEMRKHHLPLFSLENREEISHFDFWGFTFQYEMSYTNILNMMDLAGIPIHSEERDEQYPLIVAGGPCAYNPEPMADFIDIFIIGEGEEVNLELLQLYEKHCSRGYNKRAFLEEAVQIQGIYVPLFYDVQYEEDGRIQSFLPNYTKAPEKVKKRYVKDLSSMYVHTKMLVSYIELIHDRVSLEIFRGCTHGCRFCQAGMLYRPIREKTVPQILEQALQLADSTGYEDVSLSSLSSCDYSELLPLVRTLMNHLEKKKVGVSLPSLRLDTFSIDVLKEIERVRKTGLTFAPEAGSQRMRDVINKGIKVEDLIQTISYVFKEGWSGVKLYFMIGLPTERDEDVMGIRDIAYKVRAMFFEIPKEERRGNLKVTASTSCFVPKPFTPFQWVPQDTLEEFRRKILLLKNSIHDPKISYHYHDPEISRMEGVLARGDRRVGRVIELAWKMGQKFDGWDQYFNYENWMSAVEQAGLDPDFYTTRKREEDELFPWDFIDIGVSKDYLLREYHRAMQEETTSDCRKGCNACGIQNCEMWGKFHEH